MVRKEKPDLIQQTPSRQMRPTIGLLCDMTYNEYNLNMWRGVYDAACAGGANLIHFPGGVIDNMDESTRLASVLYDLVSAETLAGLVIWGAQLGHYIGPQKMQEFCQHYHPLPVVNIGLPLAGIPSVLVDNCQGMRDVVTHLIEAHNCRRIAFLGGQSSDVEAQERYRGYAQALTEHGLALEAALVVGADEVKVYGRRQGWDPLYNARFGAINLLLDERQLRPQLDFDAVVGYEDNNSIGVIEELQRRGCRVPYDVAVASFDNIAEAGYTTPPLTTANQSVYELGARATEMLLSILQGEKAPEQVVLPIKVIIRQSCGCVDAVMKQATAVAAATATVFNQNSLHLILTKGREQFLAAIRPVVGSKDTTNKWAGQLLDACVAELTQEKAEPFRMVLEEVLRQVATTGGDVAAWQGVLSILRWHINPALGEASLLARAEELWLQARVTISEMARRIQAYQTFQYDRQAMASSEISRKFITTFSIDQLMDMLAENLPYLGIAGAYLSLYNNPAAPTEMSRLALAYNEHGRVKIEAGRQTFPSRQLAPANILPHARPYSLIVEPLYFQQNQLGFVLFEIDPHKFNVYHTMLRGQISSALKGALLVQQEEKRVHQLQNVAEVGTVVSTILDTSELLQSVVDLTKTSFGLYHAHIYLFDEISNSLALAAGAGEVGRLMVADKWRIPSEQEQSLVAKAFRTRQGVKVNDVRGTPDWLPNPLLPDTCSELAVPLIAGERVLGVLDVQSAELGHFTQDDIRIQTMLAAQVAVALENARLFEQSQKADVLLRERVKELDCLNDIGREMEETPPPLPELLQWITERIPAAMHYPDLSVAAIEFDGRVYGRPEAIQLPNQITHGLYIAGQLLGRIYIAHTERCDFIDEESALLGGIATRVSGFIENQRLFEQTRQRATALEEATNFLDSIIENIPVTLFVKDAENLRFIRWNKAGEELLGFNREDMIGKNDYDFFPKEEADFFIAKDREVLNGGQLLDIPEEPMQTAHGLRLLHTKKIPVYGPDGQPRYLLGISEDITERKQTEEEHERLLAEVRRLAAIVENHPDFIGVGTMSGQILYVNPSGLKMMGLPPDYNVSAIQINDFYPPEDADRLLREGVPQALAKGFWSTETNLRQADGVIVPVEEMVSIIIDAEGQPSSFGVTMHDITNRKVAAVEQARLLTEVEAAYRQFVRREWEKYLIEQHQGQWHIEHQLAGSPIPEAEAWLAQAQAQVRQEGKTKITSGVAASDETPMQDKAAALVAPIALRGQVIGTLNLQDVSNNRVWTAEEIALVEAVSEQLALTVENLRLFDDTQRRATREQLTRQITDKLHVAPDVDSIIQTGLTELAKSLGVSRAYVKLSSQTGQDK